MNKRIVSIISFMLTIMMTVNAIAAVREKTVKIRYTVL